MTTTLTPARTRKRSIVLAALAAAAVTSLANLAIASISLAMGTPSTVQLTPGPYISFSILAGVVGAIGWAVIRGRAKNPRRVLRVLAPAVLVASFVPLAVLAVGTVATLGWAPTITLAIMHTATVGLAVAAYSQLLPVRR